MCSYHHEMKNLYQKFEHNCLESFACYVNPLPEADTSILSL